MTDILHPQRLVHINRLKNKKDFAGHTDDVLSIAISGDGKILATGGSDKRICIWETSTMKHLKTFTQHRGPVMVLTPCIVLISRALHADYLQINFTPQALIEH
jgi:WD40 repeat protein